MKHCPHLVRIAVLGGLLGALPGAGACKSEPASHGGAATSPDDPSAPGTGASPAAGSADRTARPAAGDDGDADTDADQAEPGPALTALAGEAVGMPEGPERPRFSPDGRWIAFHGGPEGARQIFVMPSVMPHVRPGGAGQPGARPEVKQVTRLDGDSRDPAWSPDGTRLVFANNAAGHYDLHVMPLTGGAPERITDWPGDELEPAVAPIRFAFYAVADDSCTPEGASGNQVDGYEKIAFTRRHGQPAREEVWFVSMRPGDAAAVRMAHDEAALSAHAAHKGLLSPKGKQCRAPSFSGDGLSLVWTCDSGGPVVYDGEARWEQSFKAALASVRSEPVPACQPESYDQAACFAKLPRRYTRFVGPAVSKPSEGLARPSVSTNQILLVADANGRPMYRDRGRKNAPWQPIALDQGTAGAAGGATGSPPGNATADARNVVWAPDGSGVAFDAAAATGRTIAAAPTHFYLQEVRNLNRFPLLYGKGQSRKLQQSRFLARPGTHKEFYALYEQLRYGRVPQYVTADAALQVYRDEFIRLLQDAEKKASEHLRSLSKALLDTYAARLDQAGAQAKSQDRYLAVYFATAWAVLEAAATMEQLDPDAYLYAAHSAGDGADPEEAARFADLSRPPIERMPAAIPGVLAKLPAAIRQDVTAHIDAMLAHAGVGDLAVPGRPRPARVDWSQFKVRGPYAESELAGYFLAMSWYAQAPLPLDASLEALLRTMESEKTGSDGRSLMDTWTAVDAMVGAFMGKPVDATMAHLAEVRAESPALLSPFDAEAVAKRLEALRGPMPLRDAEAVESNQGARKIQVTFFPKRMGLDTTFFRALTHPDVPLRGMPSALDVMAVLGSERAHEHAITASAAAAADAAELTEAYRKALDALIATRRAEGLPATDIYHAWLAALVALATAHDVPAKSLMTFARTEAWQDRLLLSALGGYTQLKHAATLYNMQDMSAECGDDASYYLLVEQPIQPVPHGFVDPVPAFFDALAGVADRVYQVMHDDPAGPETPFWHDDSEVPLNARNFARDLARIARRELEGKPLRPADLRWIELVGARLEALTLNMPSSDGAQSIGAQARAERGVALATDIHTNLMRGQVVQLAIGRIMDFWVAVPDGVGQTMTQGGIFSFYEFTQPMSDRLDDAQWAERVSKGQQPPLPAWTDSFVGPAIR